MKMDGLKSDEIERYLKGIKSNKNGDGAKNEDGGNNEEDQFKTKMKKYDMMAKIMPEVAVRNKVLLNIVYL